MLTKKQLDTLKNLLLEEKENLSRTIQADEGILARESERDRHELSAYDNHPADLGSELYEREKDMALSVHEEDQLGKVEAALTALEEGTYGKCRVCGQEINYERLEAIPYTDTCVAHSAENSIEQDRPAEEDYLKPAYDNTFADRHDRQGVRDYEDTFQDVARFGTSETPSDFEGDYDSYQDLYENEIREGFTEEYEMFTGNDAELEEVEVFQTDTERKYEETLEEENIDAPFGDLPFHETDGYVDRDKKK
ncbi:TraR/DksA C4-type zinc finger protein [Siminovitchia sediminis]|uniref:TraR/DksA C4-type zinc finger protein n=1 Tax=Siminovitchia sediminis TaxID=1274353 RepID=A0ABW4KER1_9BACI